MFSVFIYLFGLFSVLLIGGLIIGVIWFCIQIIETIFEDLF